MLSRLNNVNALLLTRHDSVTYRRCATTNPYDDVSIYLSAPLFIDT